MGITIKDAPLVEQLSGDEKIPISDGSNEPRTVNVEQIKEFANKDIEIPTKVSELENDSGYATSKEVEDAISKIPTPDVGGQISAALVDYVKKVEGKGLSTNDFTNELKTKLEGITPYDPSELEAEISKLETALNTLVGGNASNAIESFNEIIAFLENVSDKETLGGIIAGINTRIAEAEAKIPTKVSELENDKNYLTEHQDISHLATKDELKSKQDVISDLANIREGAAKGYTAIQEEQYKGTIAAVDTDESIDDPNIPSGSYDDTEIKAQIAELASEVEGKQETLVSGQNIKTINGKSLLGEGDIKIEGGSSYDDTELKNQITDLETEVSKKADEAETASKLFELGLKVDEQSTKEVVENGLFFTDKDGNIGAKIDGKGFDANPSDAFKGKILNPNVGFEQTVDDGFFVCDKNGNIGFSCTKNGLAYNSNRLSFPKPSSLIRIFVETKSELPTVKDVVIQGHITVDIDGYLLSKYLSMEVQGSSSAAYSKKNWTFGFYDDKDCSNEFEWRLNNMPAHSEYVWKANYIDATHARNIVSNRLWDDIVKSRNSYPQKELDMTISESNRMIDRFTSGALGHVDGFPSILYINNVFYGIGCFNIGKKRQNYNLIKDNQSNIQIAADDHCDFYTYNESEWEVRNPKEPDSSFNSKIENWFRSNSLAEDDFKNEFPLYHNLVNAVDYYLFIELLKAEDCIDKNFLLTSWDSIVYSFMPYDLDSTWGLWYDGKLFTSATGSVLESTNNIKNTSAEFWRKFKNCYVDNIRERYKELRDKGIFSLFNFYNLFYNFMSVFGVENYEKEFSKWYIPSNNIIKTGLPQIMDWATERLEYMDIEFNYN